jgi:hypothetical protein
MSKTSNSLYHNTITVPSTLCLRSTVPIVSSRSNATTAFSENLTSNPYNHEITQILPFLYLGSQNDALSRDKMKVSLIVYSLFKINLKFTCKLDS